MKVYTDTVETEIGAVVLATNGKELVSLYFEDRVDRMLSYLRARFGDVDLVPAVNPSGYSTRIRQYFGGDMDAFQGIAVDTGGTPFQQRVWAELREIPPGQTRSYGQLAATIGQPTAARAVGMANARNPISLVIPCHRVIGSDTRLTGYGGGVERKRWLLAHERSGFLQLSPSFASGK